MSVAGSEAGAVYVGCMNREHEEQCDGKHQTCNFHMETRGVSYGTELVAPKPDGEHSPGEVDKEMPPLEDHKAVMPATQKFGPKPQQGTKKRKKGVTLTVEDMKQRTPSLKDIHKASVLLSKFDEMAQFCSAAPPTFTAKEIKQIVLPKYEQFMAAQQVADKERPDNKIPEWNDKEIEARFENLQRRCATAPANGFWSYWVCQCKAAWLMFMAVMHGKDKTMHGRVTPLIEKLTHEFADCLMNLGEVDWMLGIQDERKKHGFNKDSEESKVIAHARKLHEAGERFYNLRASFNPDTPIPMYQTAFRLKYGWEEGLEQARMVLDGQTLFSLGSGEVFSMPVRQPTELKTSKGFQTCIWVTDIGGKFKLELPQVDEDWVKRYVDDCVRRYPKAA